MVVGHGYLDGGGISGGWGEDARPTLISHIILFTFLLSGVPSPLQPHHRRRTSPLPPALRGSPALPRHFPFLLIPSYGFCTNPSLYPFWRHSPHLTLLLVITTQASSPCPTPGIRILVSKHPGARPVCPNLTICLLESVAEIAETQITRSIN